MSGTTYKQREIVLVPFPYSDLSSTKRRPVLIVSNDSYNQNFRDVLGCVNEYAAKFDYDLEAIYKDIKEQEKQNQHKVVSLPPKKPELVTVEKAY